MRVCIVSAAFMPAEAHGGVPFSTYSLAKHLAALGCEVRVVTTDRNGQNRLAIPTDRWTTYDALPVRYLRTYSGPYIRVEDPEGILADTVSRADVVISSSTLWNHLGLLTARYCSKYAVPNVVYPRGLLEPWALRSKRLRKLLFLHTQGRFILHRASLLVALNHHERRAIEMVTRGKRIEVIPNGASPMTSDGREPGSPSQLPRLPDRYLLFLGRISNKKGLEQTFGAFASLLQSLPAARLVIAGPVEDAYRSDFAKLVESVPPHTLTVLPPVFGAEKAALLCRAAGFILTSKSEGMPMAVLEAMSAGVPVIVTPECNIDDVAFCNAGWVVRVGDVAATAAAIRDVFTNAELSFAKGQNGAQLVSDAFTWGSIARRTYAALAECLPNR